MDTFRYHPIILVLLLLPQFGHTQDIKQVPGRFVDLMYRPADGFVYALGANPDFSGYLAQVDAAFGTVVAGWPIGKAFGPMALAADGNSIYLSKSDSIFRFNLSSKVFDLHFHHQLGATGSNFPIQIVPLPGQSATVAVLWQNGASNLNYVTLYDNGVRRPDYVSTIYDIGWIDATDDGAYLFGYDRYTSGSTISRMNVTPAGPQLTPSSYYYIREFSSGLQCIGERIYGTDGAVVGRAQDTVLSLLGRLQTHVNGSSVQGRVLRFGENSDSLFFLNALGNKVYLSVFHRYNFQRLSQRLLALVNSANPVGTTIALDAPHNVAFLAGNDLIVVRTCTPQLGVPPAPAAPLLYHCQDDTLQLAAPGNFPSDRYIWSDGFRGQNHALFPAQNREISYRVADDAGCMSPSSPPVSIQLAYPPGTPYIAAEGASLICAGGGFATLLATPPNNFPASAFGYEWSDGQTGQRIQVTAPGSFICRLVTAQGCKSGPSFPLDVTTSAQPQPPQPMLLINGGDGDTQVCSVDTAQLLAPAGFTKYFWSDGVVEFDNARPISKNLTLRLVVENNAGCRSVPSVELDIRYAKTPAKPQIVKAQNVLASSAAAGNQWFRDGIPIPGATGQYLSIDQAGAYTVQVTLVTGCPSDMSAPVQF